MKVPGILYVEIMIYVWTTNNNRIIVARHVTRDGLWQFWARS